MDIKNSQTFFIPEEKKLSIAKDFGQGIMLYADIFLLSEKFIEYQKDLFNEFLADVLDKLNPEEDQTSSMDQVKRYFEAALQDLNAKLNIFSEKLKDVEKLEIRGVIQLFWQENYIASMIGNTSIVIFRNNKLSYVVSNEVDKSEKIDTFSEFIEGELETGDEIMSFGLNISNVMDEEEIQEVLDVAIGEERELMDIFEEMLITRMNKEEIVFMQLLNVEIGKIFTKPEFKKKMFDNMKFLEDVKNFVIKNRFMLAVMGGVIVVIFLIYTIVSAVTSGNEGEEIMIDGQVFQLPDHEEVLKEIDMFKKMDAASDEKAKKYKEILEKIDLLEKAGVRPYDVEKYRGMVNEEYYRGFNIVLLNSNINYNRLVGFTEDEIASIGNPHSIFYNTNGFVVAGNQGYQFGAVNENVRGKTSGYDIPDQIQGCKTNLLNNGIYCYSSENNMFNITKSGMQSVTTRSGSFPKIDDIGTYKSSNMYVMSNQKDLNEKGVYVVRYSNIPGSQTSFVEGVNYPIKSDYYEQNKEIFGSGFADFVVDGTFLMWNKANAKLYQFQRQTDGNMTGREVPMVGGDNLGDMYSQDVKVMTTPSSRYVYLFDKQNDTFTVYRSAPYKDNTAYTTSYKLIYFFRLKFDVGADVIDTYIDHGAKPILYFLTKEGIYKVKLYDFFDTFAQE